MENHDPHNTQLQWSQCQKSQAVISVSRGTTTKHRKQKIGKNVAHVTWPDDH